MIRFLLATIVSACVLTVATAEEPTAQAIVSSAVKAIGGVEKQLKVVKIKETLVVNADPNAKGSTRVSYIKPPTEWWLGKRERVNDDKEPAIFLVWGWTLGAITDTSSEVSTIPAIDEDGKKLVGLRVGKSIKPEMDLYFDADYYLVRIDWRSDIHRFSDWKEFDGSKYPAKCVGYKKATGKPWYYTQILELERLNELPAEVRKKE